MINPTIKIPSADNPITSDPGLKATSEVVPTIEDYIARCAASSAAAMASWKAWMENQPRPFHCEKHPESDVTVDEFQSAAKSRRDGENCIVLKCHQCEADEHSLLVIERMKRCGVPEDMLHCSIENWRPRNTYDEGTLKRVVDYANNPRGALILVGEQFGVGKTHLAISVLRKASLAGLRSMKFTTQATLISNMRDAYGDPYAEDIVERCINTRLLVVDDLGLSTGGRDEIPAIHRILDNRKTSNKPFIVTSNIESVQDLDSIIGQRMMDRLMEFTFAARVLSGESMRKNRFE